AGNGMTSVSSGANSCQRCSWALHSSHQADACRSDATGAGASSLPHHGSGRCPSRGGRWRAARSSGARPAAVPKSRKARWPTTNSPSPARAAPFSTPTRRRMAAPPRGSPLLAGGLQLVAMGLGVLALRGRQPLARLLLLLLDGAEQGRDLLPLRDGGGVLFVLVLDDVDDLAGVLVQDRLLAVEEVLVLLEHLRRDRRVGRRLHLLPGRLEVLPLALHLLVGGPDLPGVNGLVRLQRRHCLVERLARRRQPGVGPGHVVVEAQGRRRDAAAGGGDTGDEEAAQQGASARAHETFPS